MFHTESWQARSYIKMLSCLLCFISEFRRNQKMPMCVCGICSKNVDWSCDDEIRALNT